MISSRMPDSSLSRGLHEDEFSDFAWPPAHPGLSPSHSAPIFLANVSPMPPNGSGTTKIRLKCRRFKSKTVKIMKASTFSAKKWPFGTENNSFQCQNVQLSRALPGRAGLDMAVSPCSGDHLPGLHFPRRTAGGSPAHAPSSRGAPGASTSA